MLQDLLEQKFGPAPAWVQQRLQQTDAEQRRGLARSMLAADSLQALFQDSAGQPSVQAGQ
ncbi:hypothetical protein [Bordetella genomosp. 13]|uniref:hypothetical protein n=1 Tax=Bordetella genomosp. 13 TaxID=463040 RepID=UPI0011A1A553|nr:hypothetical protein [Bordetella genomosp. 13]